MHHRRNCVAGNMLLCHAPTHHGWKRCCILRCSQNPPGFRFSASPAILCGVTDCCSVFTLFNTLHAVSASCSTHRCVEQSENRKKKSNLERQQDMGPHSRMSDVQPCTTDNISACNSVDSSLCAKHRRRSFQQVVAIGAMLLLMGPLLCSMWQESQHSEYL